MKVSGGRSIFVMIMGREANTNKALACPGASGGSETYSNLSSSSKSYRNYYKRNTIGQYLNRFGLWQVCHREGATEWKTN
jgi:hypothetical protein